MSQGFDKAIIALKEGKKVSRQGWNKPNAFVFKGVGNTVSKDYIPNFKSLPPSVIESLAKIDKDVVFNDSFDFVDEDGSITRGYSPSTQDMLAEDWVVLD